MFYLIALLSGILSVLGFSPWSLIIVCFISYSLLFVCLEKATTRKKAFGYGFTFGFGQGSISMLWLINALLIGGENFLWAIPIIPIGFGIFFGLFFALPALLSFSYQKPISKIVVFASLMGIFEWVRSWFLTGFPWNLVGSVWVACLPVLQTASVVGVYGLTIISLCWFAFPYFFYKRKYRACFVLILSFLFILGLGFLRIYTIPMENVIGVKLRLVQANIPQTFEWNPTKAEENFMKHIRLSKTNKEDKITHILWPETASPYILNEDKEALSMTMMALLQDQVLLTGSLRAIPEKRQYANSVFVINDLGKILFFADKVHLVPFGEYIPLEKWLPLQKLVPLAGSLASGQEMKTLALKMAPPVGIVNCYEIIFPHQVVNRKYRPDWLFNATYDGWYGLSSGPYQHLASAQMRAVEEGLPVVRVATTGISALILPTGKIQASIPLGQEGVLDVLLPKAFPETFYAQFGNSIPLIIAFLVIAFIAFSKKTTRH